MTDTVQDPLPAPSFQFVAQAFVVRYYRILYGVPSNAHLFYQDISQLGRSDDNGEISNTTTLEAIKEKILSMNYDHLRARIVSVDSQESCNNGVKVLVIGNMIGPDNLARNFAQSFFLAPKEGGGYFILNDIFRFVDQDPSHMLENEEIVAPIQINVERSVDIMDNVEVVPPIQVVDEAPNAEAVVDVEKVPPVDEVPNAEKAVDAKDVPFVDEVPKVAEVPSTEVVEVPNAETLNDAEKVPSVEVVEVPNEETEDNEKKVPLDEVPLVVEEMNDAGEVPSDEVVDDEVPNAETVVGAEEVPLVDDVSNAPTVVDQVLVPLDGIVDETPNAPTVVDAEQIPLVDEVPNAPINAEEVPVVEISDEVLNVPTVVDEVPNVDAEEVPPVEIVDKGPKVPTMVDGEETSLVDVPNALTAVDVERVPIEVVKEASDTSRVVDAKEVPLSNDVVDETLIDSRMVESESKTEEVVEESHASIETGATSSSHAPVPSVIQEQHGSHLQPSILEESNDYSIYIKCLPLNVTHSLLEEEFKRFGAIKGDGIQFKSNKQGFCFGFVEFVEEKSVKRALMASPVVISGHQVSVEEKRPSYPRGLRGAHRFRNYRMEDLSRGQYYLARGNYHGGHYHSAGRGNIGRGL